MIESSFSYPSWDLEPLENFTDIPIVDFDDCFGLESRNCTQFSSISRLNESSNSSSDSDGFCFGTLKDIDKLLPVADSFISGLLEESNSGFQDEWLFVEEDESQTLPVESSSTSMRVSPTKSEKSLDYLSSKLWSDMTENEQIETLHSLSKIVTCHMGIKNQVEVIRIVDPSVTISPEDKEFTLDISRVNDTKLKRIQDLVRNFLSNSSKLKKSSSKNISSQKPLQSSKVLSRRTNCKAKRRQKKQKTCANEDIRQKRKLELHGEKELRSGLFVYEKVLKLSCPLEDEDVNILE